MISLGLILAAWGNLIYSPLLPAQAAPVGESTTTDSLTQRQRFTTKPAQSSSTFYQPEIEAMTATSSFTIYLPIIFGPLPTPKFANPSFEDVPDTAWTELSDTFPDLIVEANELPTTPNFVTPRTGNRVVWLGGANDESGEVSQAVFIPTGAASVRLGYWYWIESSDPWCNSTVADAVYIEANSTNDRLFTHELCIFTNTGGWVKKTIDITRFQGQTVTFFFAVETDSIFSSDFFLDDVFFEITP
jgi:hypothetical protein